MRWDCNMNLARMMQFKMPRRSIQVFHNFCFRSDFFDHGIRSSEHAWLLGFAFGDWSVYGINGCNEPRAFKINLQYIDVDVLHNITSILEMNLPISIQWHGTSLTRRPQCRMVITNPHFASTLVKLGCVPNKSKILSFPQFELPHEYMRDFIRGYTEADGWGRMAHWLCYQVDK